MPLRDGRSTGEEMKVSALAAGSVASGDPPASPPLSPAISTQWQREPSRGPQGVVDLWDITPWTGGLCDLGGTAGPLCAITCLQGAWAKVCIINMLVPARPSPALVVLPHRGCCQQCLSAKGFGWAVGDWGGLHSDLHPSIRLWHLGGSGS